MSFLKTINVFRRKFTRKLARYIGRSKPGQLFEKVDAGDVKTILINRPNHRLGNLLLITPLLQELIRNFPECKIDLFVKGGLPPILFKNYPQVNKIIRLPKKPFKEPVKYAGVWLTIRRKRYDLVINADKVSSSGRIATKIANARHKFFGDENEAALSKYKDGNHMAKRPVYLLRKNLVLPVTGHEQDYVPSLSIKLSAAELEKGKAILDALVPAEKKTISIFTYATGTKCYTPEWWGNFYGQLQNNFPGYNILEILPAENVSQIGFTAPSFYSMDVREICAVIANTTVFIGADSGMMHLAVASLTPVIGLFSVTNMSIYEPYNNNSRGINTNETGIIESMNIISELLKSSRKESAAII